MNFRNGYLGAFLIVIAVVLTVGGSYVLSLDVSDKEVTRYNQVAELTGLFETESSPAFINYNPSTNFTGYYTDPDTKYFNGVNVTYTSQPSQYRLNLAPTTDSKTALDLTDYTSDSDRVALWYWSDNDSLHLYNYADHIAFSELATALGITSGEITILSDFDSWETGEWFTMINRSSMSGTSVYMRAPSVSGDLLYRDAADSPAIVLMDSSDAIVPALASVYNVDTHSVSVYYDREMTKLVNNYTDSDTLIVWDTDTINGFTLGYEGTKTVRVYPPRTFMDIREGVSLEESI